MEVCECLESSWWQLLPSLMEFMPVCPSLFMERTFSWCFRTCLFWFSSFLFSADRSPSPKCFPSLSLSPWLFYFYFRWYPPSTKSFPSGCSSLFVHLIHILVFAARGSQIMMNYLNKSTGKLSKVTVFITITCNLIRAFTILVETPQDIGYFLNAAIPLMVNSCLLGQFYLYKKKLEWKWL